MLARALAGIAANGDAGSATWWPPANAPAGGAPKSPIIGSICT